MDFVQYLSKHPPRCIAGFVAEPIRVTSESLGHPSQKELANPGSELLVPLESPEYICPAFALSCKCGNREFRIKCFSWFSPEFNEVVVLSPIELKCVSCGRMSEVIDTDKHGYDPEVCGDSATYRAIGERIFFSCVGCKSQVFRILVQFEQAVDVLTSSEIDASIRIEDRFTWFTLFGACADCAIACRVADFERA